MAASDLGDDGVDLDEDLRSADDVPKEWRSRKEWAATKVVLVFYGFFQILALLLALTSSTMTSAEYLTFPPRVLPGSAAIENYANVIFETRFLDAFLDQLIYAAGGTVGIVVLGALGGYALAKFEFFGKRLMMLIVLWFVAVPFQLLSIPLFKMLSDIGWISTYHGAILPSLAAPIGLFFMKQNIEQAIETDMLKSARVDGASEFQIFYHIALPLLKPGLFAIGTYMFLIKMKEFYWPLIVMRGTQIKPYTVWLAQLRGGMARPDPYHIILPAGFMMTVFLLAIFLWGQRYFIRGLTGGSMKG